MRDIADGHILGRLYT